MVSKNIINIIMIFIIIGIIIYFYFNKSQQIASSPKINKVSSIKKIPKPKHKKKKVRFNNKVTCHYYDKDTPYKSDLIDMDKILYTESDKEIKPIIKKFNIQASNVSLDLPDQWDSNFGLPLVDKDERKVHFDRVQKSNKNYAESISDFVEYQVDSQSIVEPEFKIDPFKPNKKSLSGMAIRDIYDKQVEGPRAKPKQIKKETPSMIYYEDEVANNGGIIEGTNLRGYGSYDETFMSSAFSNQF